MNNDNKPAPTNGREDLLSKLRALTRSHAKSVWKAHKAGDALQGENARIAKAMASHPEWIHLWDVADDFEEGEILTEGGVSPFAAIAVEALVDGIVSKQGDKHARRTYLQLIEEGLSDRDAQAEVGRVFLGVYWEAGKQRIPNDQFTRRFHHCLKRVRAGESSFELFPDHD